MAESIEPKPLERGFRITYLSLSNFYFWFFALLGGLAPYWTVYLDRSGFSHVEIGQLMSILMLTKVLAPNVWSWWGDRSGKRLRLIRWGAFLGCLSFSLFFWHTGFYWYALAMSLFSFFWNAILPQFEVVTLHNLGARKHQYSLVRLWGSMGFIVSVFGLGALFEFLPIDYLPWFLFSVLILIWLSSLARFQEPVIKKDVGLEGVFSILAKKDVQVFLLVNFLLQVSHGAYYTFFSLYLEELGYTKLTTGLLWAEGVVAEVILFLFMHRLLARFSLKRLMGIALAVTTVRWGATAYLAGDLWWLILIQLGHAASFGIMHATAIHFIHEQFRGYHEGQGQAFYSAASFGAGGAVGALLCGFLTQWIPLGMLFAVSASVSGVALFLSITHFFSDGVRGT